MGGKRSGFLLFGGRMAVEEGVLADNQGAKGGGWGQIAAKIPGQVRKRPSVSHRRLPPPQGQPPPVKNDAALTRTA
jgi:hypothetical protein